MFKSLIRILPCVPGIMTLIHKNIALIILVASLALLALSEPLNLPKFKSRAHCLVYICVSQHAFVFSSAHFSLNKAENTYELGYA